MKQIFRAFLFPDTTITYPRGRVEKVIARSALHDEAISNISI